MPDDFGNAEFARNNEEFADDILDGGKDQPNWVVTIRFYSFLHYVEERLQCEGMSSNNHKDRKQNIRACRAIDNRVRTIYRTLEDISRDARYECIQMTEQDLEESAARLEEGKEILGFSDGGTDAKYSI